MLVIGCDPGANTGIAIYKDGKLSELATLAPESLFDFLDAFDQYTFVFENSLLQTHVWVDPNLSIASKLTIARKIGRVDGQCAQIVRYLENKAVPYIAISPKQKGSKVTKADVFNQITGCTGESNGHTRDAAMVARPYRYVAYIKQSKAG